MTKEERNREAVRTFYEAAAAGKRDIITAMLSDDLVIREGSSLPYAGEYRGKDALATLSGKVRDYYGGMTLDVHEICAGGDWVFALLDLRPGSKDDRVELVEGSRFNDEGKIVEIKPFYFDHEHVRRLGASRA